MRLFIGLELPGTCRETLAGLDPGIAGLRWMTPERIHLTLSFLGEVEVDRLESLRQSLETVRVAPFFLPIQGVGSFGGPRPSVVWAGVGKGHPHLFALHKHVQDAVLRVGLEADLKPFHPHVTIGRARNVSRAALAPFLRRHAESEFALCRIEGFTLFSSQLAADGALHTAEARFA